MWQIVIFLMGMATVFTILMLLAPHSRLIFGMLSMILWFGLAVQVTSIDIPYTYLYENAADNSYTVVEGIHTVGTAAHWWILFFGLGMLSFVVVAIIIDK